jgi:hypothetical protein
LRSSAIPPNIANITFLDTSTGNVCLDGSAPAYYYRQEAETKKVYLHQVSRINTNGKERIMERRKGRRKVKLERVFFFAGTGQKFVMSLLAIFLSVSSVFV